MIASSRRIAIQRLKIKNCKWAKAEEQWRAVRVAFRWRKASDPNHLSIYAYLQEYYDLIGTWRTTQENRTTILRGWVQSSPKFLHELWWKCTTSAEYKTDISAVLTVTSGLDPHMINKLKDGLKSHSGYFLWPCWVPTISLLTLAYCCSEGKVAVKSFEDVAEF